MKINYESDFKLNEVSEVVDTSTPFRFKYRTSGITSYVAQFDGITYTNCRRLDDGSLLVIFDNHSLPTGVLQVRREYFLTDSDFADNVCNKVTLQQLDVTLVNDAGEEDDPTVDVYPAYQKGDSFTYDDFTEQQLLSLKGEAGYTPVKGVDYFTDDEKQEFADQFLMYDNLDLDNIFAYGIEFNTTVSSPICRRIGNLSLHCSLPIQSQMRGCLLDDSGSVAEYLPAGSWESAVRDGSRGQVMVEIPEYYCKFVTRDNLRQVWISATPLNGYHKVAKCYVSAYEATIQRSESKLCSVVNTTADYRGGNNNAAFDSLHKSQLGLPAVQASLTTFRTYARKRNDAATAEWNCLTYEVYKSLYWLFTVEYSTLNCQTAVTAELSSEGYKQGGLGNGVTNLADWGALNDVYPVVPCGYSDSLGNGSGEVAFQVTDSNGDSHSTIYVNRYRGVENPFGHIWKWIDGVLIDNRMANYVGDFADESRIFTCDDPAKFASYITLSDSYEGYQFKGNGSRSDGYGKILLFGERGDIIPKEVGASSSTYHSDLYYVNVALSTVCGVYQGGIANSGQIAGLQCFFAKYNANATSPNLGSRLCFHPNN